MSTPFDTQTRPYMADLEARISALETALLTLTDGAWTRFTAVDGGAGVTVDLQPSVYVSQTIASGSAVALTSDVPAAVASISLPAGYEYSVEAQVVWTATGAGTQQVGYFAQGINTSVALPSSKNDYSLVPRGNAVLVVDLSAAATPVVLDLRAAGGATTVYLVARTLYSGGSGGISAYGWIRAKRGP